MQLPSFFLFKNNNLPQETNTADALNFDCPSRLPRLPLEIGMARNDREGWITY
jgi:hypothetical protein